ncbi:amyotrophic lateral sclerosis 2 chromosomalregion candidate gene 11 protein [Striga asiatica]|uniref:Amyotrophic lateral sclerosis 2 chromosomalregion candidate gene 11 protein n=1 Tax=Striga asiatica TaxID=4170 RepID=A0A5A7QPJ6_STRAF|nr:amyotrophic lateral sclerosis 2 chromosomalregion candidate gene 11 protein [Striga asiatica]
MAEGVEVSGESPRLPRPLALGAVLAAFLGQGSCLAPAWVRPITGVVIGGFLRQRQPWSTTDRGLLVCGLRGGVARCKPPEFSEGGFLWNEVLVFEQVLVTRCWSGVCNVVLAVEYLGLTLMEQYYQKVSNLEEPSSLLSSKKKSKLDNQNSKSTELDENSKSTELNELLENLPWDPAC